MNILYIGDVMAQRGIDAVKHELPNIREKYDVDVIIAQAENVTDGKGLSLADFDRLRLLGIDFMTGGNWSLHRPEIYDYLSDPQQPVIRPANYPESTPGLGAKYFESKEGKVLIISLLGQIVGKDADHPMQNPLKCVDAILQATAATEKAAIIVNFHGDYSSEKRVIGYYLDGRVSAVVGDHWHVPTADALVLPKGTAHITDVGMCGSLHSSLGVKLDTIIGRWRDGRLNRNEIEMSGPMQFNAVLISVDVTTQRATTISHIHTIIN
ncbi:MAG: TIGR00282 family metallophosphoesterase [Candidatus Saccharimonadales bacterium]